VLDGVGQIELRYESVAAIRSLTTASNSRRAAFEILVRHCKDRVEAVNPSTSEEHFGGELSFYGLLRENPIVMYLSIPARDGATVASREFDAATLGISSAKVKDDLRPFASRAMSSVDQCGLTFSWTEVGERVNQPASGKGGKEKGHSTLFESQNVPFLSKLSSRERGI
jgi:hypothetical protein